MVAVWLQSTPEEYARFSPSDTEKAFYMRPELFPQKSKEPLSEHRIFQARVPGLTRIQPVAMAMYGQQHHLALHLLQEKATFAKKQGDIDGTSQWSSSSCTSRQMQSSY